MRIKEEFRLRRVCSEYVVMAEGTKQVNFDKMVWLNESAGYLWDSVKDQDFTVDSLVELLQKEYEVDDETARKDAQTIVMEWKKTGFIDGE